MSVPHESRDLWFIERLSYLIQAWIYVGLSATAVVVFTYIFFIRKKREPFLLMIPTLVFAYSSGQIPSFFYAYYGKGKVEWLVSAGLFLGMVNHWLFSTQYYKTSKTLPLLVT